MSTISVVSFNELQAEILARDLLHKYQCIWKENDERCDHVLSEDSIVTLRDMIDVPGEHLDIEDLQRVGQLSLCTDHSNLVDSVNTFDGRWFRGLPATPTSYGPQYLCRSDLDFRDGGASSSCTPPQQNRMLSTFSSEVLRRPRPFRESGAVSESAVADLVNTPLVTVTPPPRPVEASRASSSPSTPRRTTGRSMAKDQQNSGTMVTEASSPSPVTTPSSRPASRRSRYSCPSIRTLQETFQYESSGNLRCIVKQPNGQCAKKIRDTELLAQARNILAKSHEELQPDDVRNVIHSLICTEANHTENQRKSIESALKKEFPHFSFDFGLPASTSSTPSRQSSGSREPTSTNDNCIPQKDCSTSPPSSSMLSSTSNRTRPGRRSITTLAPDDECFLQTDRFVKGEGSAWAPWKVRQEVSSLFTASLPTQKTSGCLYLLQDESLRYVKIGYTLGKWEERRSDIMSKAGIKLDQNSTHTIGRIPFAPLLRLEKLVHTDLKYFQRHLPTKKNNRTQHEWFEVDFSEAKQTADFWFAKISLPGGYLHRDSQIDGDDEEEKDKDKWCAIHNDHNKRRKIWETAIRLPPKPTIWQVIAEEWRKIGIVWFGGCVVVCLAAVAEPSWAKVVCGLLVALWTACAHWIYENTSHQGVIHRISLQRRGASREDCI
jgi:hypothetical protein